jgi:hypothetical protein
MGYAATLVVKTFPCPPVVWRAARGLTRENENAIVSKWTQASAPAQFVSTASSLLASPKLARPFSSIVQRSCEKGSGWRTKEDFA